MAHQAVSLVLTSASIPTNLTSHAPTHTQSRGTLSLYTLPILVRLHLNRLGNLTRAVGDGGGAKRPPIHPLSLMQTEATTLTTTGCTTTTTTTAMISTSLVDRAPMGTAMTTVAAAMAREATSWVTWANSCPACIRRCMTLSRRWTRRCESRVEKS